MKRILLGIILVATMVCGGMVARPAFADGETCTNKAQTTILNGEEACIDGEGSGIKSLLALIVDIMMAGAGILGVIGVVIVGIQYLTAAGNEEKTRKAKRRLLEIVIGVVTFIALAAILKFLIPNFGK